MSIVELLLLYRETFDESILLKGENNLDEQSLMIICTDLLSWMKLEYKRTLWIREGKHIKLRPYKLNYNYTWCNDLYTLVKNEDLFHKYFEINGNLLDMSSSLDEETKEKIQKEAFEKYNPKKHILYRS